VGISPERGVQRKGKPLGLGFCTGAPVPFPPPLFFFFWGCFFSPFLSPLLGNNNISDLSFLHPFFPFPPFFPCLTLSSPFSAPRLQSSSGAQGVLWFRPNARAGVLTFIIQFDFPVSPPQNEFSVSHPEHIWEAGPGVPSAGPSPSRHQH